MLATVQDIFRLIPGVPLGVKLRLSRSKCQLVFVGRDGPCGEAWPFVALRRFCCRRWRGLCRGRREFVCGRLTDDRASDMDPPGGTVRPGVMHEGLGCDECGQNEEIHPLNA